MLMLRYLLNWTVARHKLAVMEVAMHLDPNWRNRFEGAAHRYTDALREAKNRRSHRQATKPRRKVPWWLPFAFIGVMILALILLPMLF